MTSPQFNIIGPDFVALQVRDLNVSKRFYVERLGLKVMPGPPHAVVFDTKPITFAIREPLVDLSRVSQLGWGVVLWLAADDADALHASLVQAGVKILAPLADGPFGRFFTFSDPDGYGITVHTAKGSP